MADSHPIPAHHNFQDLTGKRFGRLIVLSYAGRSATKERRSRWNCKCDCGTAVTANAHDLRQGCTVSCGCLKRENARVANCNIRNGSRTRGVKTPEYHSWIAMMTRCYNKHSLSWSNYGGRGIIVCERWHSFAAFLQDMGKRKRPADSIDRIDNDGNYCPENCRWASPKVQGRNKRFNRAITCNGETRLLCEWVELTGIKRTTIAARLKKGWPPERALNNDT